MYEFENILTTVFQYNFFSFVNILKVPTVTGYSKDKWLNAYEVFRIGSETQYMLLLPVFRDFIILLDIQSVLP